MTKPENSHVRTTPVSVLAVVAMLAALLAAAAGGHSANAETASHQATVNTAVVAAAHDDTTDRALTPQQAAFHDQMRRLWEDHVTWTRLAIVTFADGSAGFDATARRLLANQTDIGDAIKPFYGTAAGDQLTALLDDHISIAVELLQAAKAGNAGQVSDAATRWYANANEIADFLSSANPSYWPQDTMRSAMKEHLDQTLAEAQHELAGDYAASVSDYEQIHGHILEMADLLSTGIMRQFPGSFR